MKFSGIAIAGMLAVAVVQSLHAQGTGTWTVTGNMQVPRYEHGEALLASGDVLAAGGINGNDQNVASAEIFSAAFGTWAPTGSMHSARNDFPAVRLNNGKVLVEGGFGSGTALLTSAELFDPATSSWSAAGNMSVARYAHTATLLPNGDVLVAGGCTASGCSSMTATSEIYHVATNSWSTTGSLNVARGEHTALALHSGQVLVVEGVVSGNVPGMATELYTPSTGKWTVAASTNGPHYYGSANLLQDGKVLVTGGLTGGLPAYRHTLTTAELYDPVHNSWAVTGSMTTGRYMHTSTLLPDGTALIAGGAAAPGCTKNCHFLPTASAEIFNESLGTFSPTTNLNQAIYNHSATALAKGQVLVNGGEGDITYCCQVMADSEFYSIP